MEAFQELAVWSTAGASTGIAIAFVWNRLNQRVRQRQEQQRKIRITKVDGA
jgi:uncharacterized protein YoaH (UPF0181 family)